MKVCIRPAGEEDYPRLLRIWEAAVRATHHFLTEEDIVYYRSRLSGVYLPDVELWAAETEPRIIGAFMGLTPPAGKAPAGIEMLFVHPKHHRQGVGGALVRHAASLYGPLTVDVNEQNPGAARFYERLGFTPAGRSEEDGEGKPFPLLHLFRREQAFS